MKIGWLTALFVVAVGFGFAVGFGILAQRIATDFNGSVALGVTGLVATTWFGIWQFEKTKRKEAEARIFTERAAIYHRLVLMLRNMMFSIKGWEPQKDQETLGRQMAEITYDMIVWGGQDTIRQIMNLTNQPEHQQQDPSVILLRLAELFRAIRKDLGHNDDDALPEDLALILIVSSEQDELRQKMRASSRK